MNALKSKIKVLFLLGTFSILAAVSLQVYIGNITIYKQDLETKRMLLHEAILYNKLPESKLWTGLGANTTNIRVFTVYLAQKIHELTDTSVLTVYKLIDTAALIFILILLPIYLSKWLNYSYCTIGMLYWIFATIFTYFFHYFHPWDRLSLLSWLVLLFLLRANKIVLFAILLVISMIIKYDVILLPALYWLSKISKDNWKKTTLITLILFSLTFGVYFILKALFPQQGNAMMEEKIFLESIAQKLKENYWVFIHTKITYPPLIVFMLPVLLSIMRLSTKNRFIIANTIFGLLLFIPHFLLTNAVEVRAEMPILILLLPSTLITLRYMFKDDLFERTARSSEREFHGRDVTTSEE